MSVVRHLLWSGFAAAALMASAAPAEAQVKAKAKHYVVSSEEAVGVTRSVLIRQGYTVVRVERVGPTQVVYYRRGNMGRGKGKGPMQRLVIRRVRDRVMFEETEPSVLVDIDIRLKL
jgi:hypothetical protein